jgi:hypothetical protein
VGRKAAGQRCDSKDSRLTAFDAAALTSTIDGSSSSRVVVEEGCRVESGIHLAA